MKKRGNGLKVWEFRYCEPLPEGNGRALRAATVGTLQEYPTEAAARKSDAVQSIILRVNAEHTLGPVTASNVAALIARYEEEELPSRYSTRASYQSYLDNYIRPRWGEAAINSVKAMAVEDWLKRLTLAPKTRGNIRSLMSTLFKCAQRWELVENNPMRLVRVKNVSRRLERPSVLTAEEFHKLLPHIREPYRTMVLIAGCLGFRASEIVGLQWGDFDFEISTLLVQRGVVHGRVDDVKTEYSATSCRSPGSWRRSCWHIGSALTRRRRAGCLQIPRRRSRTIRRKFRRSTFDRRRRQRASASKSVGKRSGTASAHGSTRRKRRSESSAS